MHADVHSVADAIGWSRAQVSQYAMLQKIDGEAWNIVATAFQNIVADGDSDDVAGIATGVANPFSENLLRNILDLEPAQQLDLCKCLARDKDKKGHKFGKAEFKTGAERYRARAAFHHPSTTGKGGSGRRPGCRFKRDPSPRRRPFFGGKNPPARFCLIFDADQGWNTRESGKQRQITPSRHWMMLSA